MIEESIISIKADVAKLCENLATHEEDMRCVAVGVQSLASEKQCALEKNLGEGFREVSYCNLAPREIVPQQCGDNFFLVFNCNSQFLTLWRNFLLAHIFCINTV